MIRKSYRYVDLPIFTASVRVPGMWVASPSASCIILRPEQVVYPNRWTVAVLTNDTSDSESMRSEDAGVVAP